MVYGLSEQIARFATAQASFETGRFTSPIFLENNNLFGYKYVGQPLAVGEARGHAVYAKRADSIQEFVEYWRRRRLRAPLPLRIDTLEQFVTYLKADIKPGPYFEAPYSLYLSGTRVHYNEIFG